ncbi:hypothetical protein GCM10007897_42770 [Sphingobium jiangsuense]|uniref:Uncharacterized protein n=1 Tax=Sphingobium jiangsuense TaxID=870476 RepID=A0A7W6FS72_9SPHN|nr:hypothetical protein [Sphingobium jiangsuense]MBB3928931.1 hypothetical protein [Sphingobium jiangsuense]GLT02852.1 hypothetical protein GCM10007897_42770 [Sphingobium jiangsuense]
MARAKLHFDDALCEEAANPDAVVAYHHCDGVGRELIWLLHEVGNDALGRDLAIYLGPMMREMFAGMATPTVKQHRQSWVQLGSVLAECGRSTDGLRTISAADIDACDNRGQYSRFRCLIHGLRAIDAQHPDLLRADARRRLNFVSRYSNRLVSPREPLTPFVARVLKEAADERVVAARDRIFAGRERVAALRSAPSPTRFEQAILRLADGDRPTKAQYDLFKWRRISTTTVTDLRVMTLADAVYFVIALALRIEMPIECLKTLRRDCLKNPARGYVTIEYAKGRGGARARIKRERVRDGGITTPGGLIRLALDLSQPAAERLAECGHADADYLWIGFVRLDRPAWRRFKLSKNNFQHAVGDLGLHDESGEPIGCVMQSSLRKTVKRDNYLRHAGHLRRFASDHSREVAARHYASVEGLREEHARSIVAAETHLFDMAMSPLVLAPEEEQDAAEQGLSVAGRIIDGAEAAQLMGGASDTFLGICADFWSGPSPRAEDGSCAVAFTGCLHCRNAVFTRRKLPALLTYMDWLEDRRTVLTEASWAGAHGADFDRIAIQVLPAFAAGDIEHARALMAAEPRGCALPPHIVRG